MKRNLKQEKLEIIFKEKENILNKNEYQNIDIKTNS